MRDRRTNGVLKSVFNFSSHKTSPTESKSSSLYKAKIPLEMATAHLTASLISSRSLASFRGLRPSNAKLGSPAAVSLVSHRSFPGLVVHAATAVAPKYASIKPLGEIVLMRIYNVEENTGGGILLATAAAQTNHQGDDDGG